MPRYIILGAGAVGGALGGRLGLAGCSVVLVARGEHLAALREHGLRLRTPDEDVTQSVPAIGGPEEIELDVDDVLILATKTHQANEALVTWTDAPVHQNARPLAQQASACRSSLHSMGSRRRRSHRYFRRVYGVCVWTPAVHLAPGEVIIRSTPDQGCSISAACPRALTIMIRRCSRLPPIWWPQLRRPAARRCDAVEVPQVDQQHRQRLPGMVGRNGDWRPLVADAEAEARRVLDVAGIRYSEAEETAARGRPASP